MAAQEGSCAPDDAAPPGAEWALEAMVMFTVRNLGGVALLLAGTTWLWLTPAFATRGVLTSGVLWGITRVLSLLTVAAFCVATWGLFTRHAWWEGVALGAAVLGLAALVPYWVAASIGGETAGTATWNAFVHVLMVAGVFTLLMVPPVERWVGHHVMSG
jgi:hypothetical protein